MVVVRAGGPRSRGQHIQSRRRYRSYGRSRTTPVAAKAGTYIIGFGLASLLLQIFVPYTTYARYLKWLTLSLFAYIATALFVHIDWHTALLASVIPKLSLSQRGSSDLSL
jgi:hypothetical protein